jgi:transcriptional regulator with PAS, ATPase and Fis domain
VARIAGSNTTVLICGETGTGKELFARRIHGTSLRRDGPFVSVNCAAVAQTILESELFGHARGAFTDARSERTGLFERASGGTLFLDEIGEMPLEMQVKLLRALQERKVRPVGSNVESSFDARIIVATNRDLEEEVRQKRFREDLYYRVNVVRLSLPPLRERAEDVAELAKHFLARYTRDHRSHDLSSEALEKLTRYRWPGNVRELQNCIERAVALAQFDQIGVDDLPEKIRDYRMSRISVESNDPAELLPMEEVERRYILKVLEAVGGNKTLAAQVLGFDRRTLYRKLDRVREPSGREARSSSGGAISSDRIPAAQHPGDASKA